MERKKCNFVCDRLADTGDCEEIGGECIGYMCENWMACDLCRTDLDDCLE